PASPPPPVAAAHGRDPGQVGAFTERFAAMIVEVGLPRMAARVLACLFTTDSGALTAAELVRRLGVSPASVSKAVGYLEGVELIRRERDPRLRRERYVIYDDFWTRAWLTSARVNALWAETTRRGAEILGPATPAGARLEGTSRFFATLSDDMAHGLEGAALIDVLVVVAALVHAREPLTAERVAGALGWPPDRVDRALREAGRHPAAIDPLELRRGPSGAYGVAGSPGRLTAAQREALHVAAARSRAGG
uniref:GbsR/MarR family transcriptional regulator n=1 Tax=Actinomadura roseirufa TaxID=2094049 RepID=UPI0010419EFC